ncbi:MAG TPA: hypothetical protein V6D12_00580 [Candidatus Obscuribacterales bacterium]
MTELEIASKISHLLNTGESVSERSLVVKDGRNGAARAAKPFLVGGAVSAPSHQIKV